MSSPYAKIIPRKLFRNTHEGKSGKFQEWMTAGEARNTAAL
jgi:hypothetical protein